MDEEKKRRKKAAKQVSEEFDIEEAITSVDVKVNIESARKREKEQKKRIKSDF